MDQTKPKTKNEEIARLVKIMEEAGWQVELLRFEPRGGPFDKRPAAMHLTIKLSPLPSRS
jgi:hypothetical protein